MIYYFPQNIILDRGKNMEFAHLDIHIGSFLCSSKKTNIRHDSRIFEDTPDIMVFIVKNRNGDPSSKP